MGNKKITLMYVVSVLLLCVFLFLNPLSEFNTQNSSQRKILSSLYFTYPDVSENAFQLIKYKFNNSIFLEIYKIFPDNRFELLNQFDTKAFHDGHFLLGPNATNLAIVDIDNDSLNEIIVPVFDKNLNAELVIYKYNKLKSNFEEITAPSDLSF